MIGKILSGRYRIAEKIGTGGMADVYLADDMLLERSVAIKILHQQFASDMGFITRFKREAKAAANLRHPNIVDVHDWGNDSNCYFLVMEYVSGRTLKDVILKESPLSFERIVDYAEQICDALDTAHRNDLVHRDIKPQNIIISDEGLIKITDFGIAKSLSSTLTQGSTVFGTAYYISPEQAEGKSVGPATDIYSLGVVIYEMASGELPFRGDNPISVAMKHVYEEPVNPSYFREDIPYGLEQVILKAIDKDPQKRFQSAGELKTALSNCLDVKAPKDFVPKLQEPEAEHDARTIKIKKSKKPGKFRLLGCLLSIFALLIVGAVLTYIFWPKEPAIQMVTVPNIGNMDISTAQKMAEEEGLRLTVVEQKYDDEVEAGNIISQDPSEGEKVEKDSVINVVISKGIETTTMPDLNGITVEEAKNILKTANLNIGRIDSEYSVEVEKDHIFSQSIRAGDVVSRGVSIDLIISKGPQMVTVPQVTGMTYENAKNTITASSLTPVKQEQFNPDAEVGIVISQDPPANSSAQKDSEVILVVSVNTETSIIPDIIGMSAKEAKSKVESSGFIAMLIKIVSTQNQKNMVMKQEPDAGTSLAKGSVIRIYIGDGSI